MRLAMRVGQMNANVIRLDALGKRLTRMANLDDGEFDFGNPPALGGAEGADGQPAQIPSLTAMVDELQTQLSSREQQLGVLENLILTRELNKQVYPEGRPVQDGWISSYFGRRADPFTGYSAVHKGVDFAGPPGLQGVGGGGGAGDLRRRAGRLWRDGGDQPRQRLGDPLLPQREAAGEAGRHGAQGPGSRADGLDRPFDRPAPAFRGAQERRPGGSVALHRRGSLARSPSAPRSASRGQSRTAAAPRTAAPSAGRNDFPPFRSIRTIPSFSKDSLRVWKLLTQVFGSRNQRLIKELSRTVARHQRPRARHPGARGRAVSGEDAGAEGAIRGAARRSMTLVPEAFALVREASRRKLGSAPFRRAADRRPGAALGQDRRDAHRRGQDADGDAAGVPERAHRRGRARGHGERVPGAARLGLDGPGVTASSASRWASSRTPRSQDEKRAAYACDITYGTNNEFGFDYLRDNLAFRLEDRVQRKLSFAIVDEVDSILIDEARTPLIISGPAEESTELYIKINTLIPRLTRQKEEDGPGRLRRRREDQAGARSPRTATRRSSS